VLVRRAVGAGGSRERDFAQEEVLLELLPLLPGRCPYLSEWAQGSAPFDEKLVCGDHLVGEHRLWRHRILELPECVAFVAWTGQRSVVLPHGNGSQVSRS
jgi:hypothetical protein